MPKTKRTFLTSASVGRTAVGVDRYKHLLKMKKKAKQKHTFILDRLYHLVHGCQWPAWMSWKRKSVFMATFFLGACLGVPLYAQIGFTQHHVADVSPSIRVHPEDIDGDGDIDLVSGEAIGGKLYWWESSGAANPTFTPHQFDSNFEQHGAFFTIDVNGDGHMDILNCSFTKDEVAWWKSDGGATPTFTKETLLSNFDGAIVATAGDIDDDGDVDIVAIAKLDMELRFLENDGNPNPTFTDHLLTSGSDLTNTEGLAIGQLNTDGFPDIAVSASGISRVYMYAGDADPSDGFTRTTIVSGMQMGQLRMADMGGDGTLDILHLYQDGFTNKIGYLKNSGGSNPTFTHTTIDEFDNSFSIYPADLNSDGAMDVLGGSNWDDGFYWWENHGGSNPSFNRFTIEDGFSSAWTAKAADLDGDCDLDVVASISSKLLWFENDLYTTSSDIIYVNDDATGDNNGTSWGDAFNSLQDAIDFACDCSIDTIWVAEGTYLPTKDKDGNAPTNQRNATFFFNKDIKFYGGFPNTGDPGMAERDWGVHPTILSGDINNNDSLVTDIGDPDFPAKYNDENTYTVVHTEYVTSNFVMDGFIIKGGNADGSISFLNRGGGWYNDGSGNGNLSNPTITNCSFSMNAASLYGGAFYNHGSNGGNSSPSVNNCSFSLNFASWGGAVMNFGSISGNCNPDFTNCIFLQNSASIGGGVHNDGFGNGTSNPKFTNCTFSQNTSTFDGGAMYNNGFSGGSVSAIITNCIFWENTAANEGDIFYINDAEVTIGYSLVDVADCNDLYVGNNSTLNCSASDMVFDQPPLFVDAPNGDIHLLPCSPAINAGTANALTNDLDGNPRPFGGTVVDMGAYEFQGIISNGVVYVDSTATGFNNGSSWANAFTKLQDALALANACTDVEQVWVAKGTYYPDEGIGYENDARDSSFNLKKNLAIYGGLTGTETFPYDMSERDFTENETILSGDIDQNDGSGFINNENNSYHVVRSNNKDNTAVLDGFTITQGNANGGGDNGSGGGMFNDNGSGPMVTNCSFIGNTAIIGGGMFNDNDSDPMINNCSFSENAALNGGGGGMMNLLSSSPIVNNCSFSGNMASGQGGGMNNSSSNPTINNCSFYGNEAGSDGGGIDNSASSPMIINCSFFGNMAGRHGGGMFNISSSEPTINNCLFSGNSADGQGGGVSNSGGSKPKLTNCSFSGNSAPTGGGMHSGNAAGAVAEATNCIFWGNSSEITGNNTIVNDCIIEGGCPVSFTNCNNVLDEDPLFTDQPDHTNAPTSASNLRLLPCSPAINAGTGPAMGIPTDDLDGNPRPFSGTDVDMGCYEFQAITPFPGGVVYVNNDADGHNNGSDWDNAYTDLQTAIDAACACDDIDEIWVAEGTYRPRKDANGETPADPRNATFFFDQEIKLYGGFPNVGGTDLNDRDWDMHSTILSGDFLGDDVPITDKSDPDFPAANNNENAYTVVQTRKVTSDFVMDGFYIKGGNADFPSTFFSTNANRNGGGWYNDGLGSGNASSPTVSNCTFRGNNASLDGGAVFNLGGSSGNGNPAFNNCSFYNNNAESRGGAVFNFGENGNSGPAFNDCSFDNNNANHDGGAVYNNGSNGISSPEFNDCSFDNNNGIKGGAAFNNGSTSGISNPKFKNCSFNGNKADSQGGAVYNYGNNGASNPTFTNCSFDDNNADIQGGAMFNSSSSNEGDSSPACTNCSFTNNNAGSQGGVMFNNRSGGISSPNFTNCSFANNNADFQGGVAYSNSGSNPEFTNCILWGNTSPNGPVFYGFFANVTISHSLVEADDCGTLKVGFGSHDVTCNGNMIYNEDPLFEDAPNGDLHLMECSPAIDAGTDIAGLMDDLDGETRPFDAAPNLPADFDMGAYEYPALLPSPTALCMADPIEVVLAPNIATVMAAQVNNGSNGGCGDLTLLLNGQPSIDFGCENIGTPQSVTLSVTDAFMNTASCTATVHVKDEDAPMAICPTTIDDVVIASNELGVLPANIGDGSSTDNCSVVETSPEMVFDCSQIGQQSVVLTASDGTNSNQTTCYFNVTDADNNCCPPTHVIYVDANTPNDNNGSDWVNAYASLQDALTKADKCGQVTQIWVAGGYYHPDQGSGVALGDRSASFVLQNDLIVYGGFAGGESDLSDRNWDLNETILSGDIGTINDHTDNSYHVIWNNGGGLNTTAIIDGFIIENGNADGTGDDEKGGGLFNKNASPTVRHCQFRANHAAFGGGALYLNNSSSKIDSCIFFNNIANVGGAALNSIGATSEISNSIFSNNSAFLDGGAFYNNSALLCGIVNCTFDDNTADDNGGAIANLQSSPDIINTVFLANSATEGGAIANRGGSDPNIVNCSFHANHASTYGGAIRNHTGTVPLITNCIVWGNTADAADGEISNAVPGPIIAYSIVKQAGGTYPGVNNINDDPLFYSATDLHIQACPSPAINTGSNAANSTLYDLDGHPRKVGTIDMGAYEFQGNLALPCTWTGDGDGTYWNDASNWSDGMIPTPCRDVLIPMGHSVIVPAGIKADGRTLEVETGAELRTAEDGELDIKP